MAGVIPPMNTAATPFETKRHDMRLVETSPQKKSFPMKNKMVLVTGSTDGIGKETALQLARKGARLILHGKNPERGEEVLKEVREASGNPHHDFLCFDLSSQKKIRDLARTVEEKFPRLDVLMNNAGVYQKRRELTEDGFEMTFAVNHSAPFLLTNLLLDLLVKSAPSRVVTVGSIAHRWGNMDFTNLQGERFYDGYSAYAASKLANVLFTYALARRLRGTGVTANALHPGVIDTKLLRAGFGLGGASVERGARTPVYLASAPELEKVSGEYFEDEKPVPSSPATYDTDLQEALWEASRELCGKNAGGRA